MSRYDPKIVKPNYVREWIKDKKTVWRLMIEEKIKYAKEQALIPYDSAIDAKTVIKEGKLADIGLNVSMDSAGKLSLGSFEDAE